MIFVVGCSREGTTSQSIKDAILERSLSLVVFAERHSHEVATRKIMNGYTLARSLIDVMSVGKHLDGVGLLQDTSVYTLGKGRSLAIFVG